MGTVDLNPFDGDDSLGVNEMLDHAGEALESIVNIVVPDGFLEWDVGIPDEAAAAAARDPLGSATGDEGVPDGMANDGFYQSLPGIDPIVGVELDQTYALIDEIGRLGTEILGPEGWEQTKVTAAADIAAFEDTIESPADLEYKFTVADGDAQRRFWDWQTQRDVQGTIDGAWGVLNDPARPV